MRRESSVLVCSVVLELALWLLREVLIQLVCVPSVWRTSVKVVYVQLLSGIFSQLSLVFFNLLTSDSSRIRWEHLADKSLTLDLSCKV